MKYLHEFGPIYNKESKILILGSFPSVKSREEKFYYAHPQNRFWKVLSILFNEKIKDKKEFLLKHKIALWDVIYSCEIEGSKDSTIKNVKTNNINLIINNSNAKYIFTLGRKSYELYNKYTLKETNIKPILLPSTSPLNAKKKLEDLVEEYKIIIELLKEK